VQTPPTLGLRFLYRALVGIDYDPTNNLKPYDQHVTLAVGRDFADITPLKGIMFGGGNQVLDVSVDMNRGQ